MTRRLLDCSPDAVLVECADLAEALGLLSALEAERLPWVEEMIPGARTLLVRVSRALTPAQRNKLLVMRTGHLGRVDHQPITIKVDYGGPDLADVATLAHLSEADVIQAHTGQLWTVGFCGFAPGFAYLQGENELLRVPRRMSPRTRVPAGAVGLAGEWSGIYPREGPGGWQLIGQTSTRLWDLDRNPPALLRPGIRVRFVDGSRP
jgi:KipI family sensor histidine kinase inhibitor